MILLIWRSDFPYSRVNLLWSYLLLILRSICHHKLTTAKRFSQIKRIYLLGNRIDFFRYPEMINLVEEIFIRQVYRFNATGEGDPVIIDCGSNIGLSVLYFKKLVPAAIIFAFEPDPGTVELLRRNTVHINGVSVFECALSDESGKGMLFSPSGVPGSLRTRLIHSDGNQSTTVDVRRLSDFIDRRINLIKIDVEGSETQIIADLRRHGKLNFVDELIIEYHQELNEAPVEDFCAQLSSDGYQYSVVPTLTGHSDFILRFSKSCEAIRTNTV